nr:ankyrin repeat domain-containing protein 53 isoform X3 [Macaca fascicularis]
MASAGSTARRAGSGSWHSERGEGRGARPQPTPHGSMQRANKVSLKATWTDAASKQPSPSEESDQTTIDQTAIRSYYQLFAAAVGNVEWLRFCLNQSLREIPTDYKGFTAIHFAAQRGKLACLQVLVEEYKFPVNLLTNNSQTPLHLVIHKDNTTVALPCIYYLLEKGAALNAFLKDAMWKKDKKDFACEMRKMKTLKSQLALMEYNYLIEYQKEHKILREAAIRKWLHGKLHPGHSLVSNTKQARATALSKTPEQRGSQCSSSFHPSVEARLQCIPQPTEMPKPIYRKSTIKRPTMWNVSNNPARPPTTKISHSQGIRLGVHPDPSPEHDFSSFLEVRPDRHGGAWLHTVDGHWVAPVPRLPFEVLLRMLYPHVRPYRMKVPQGFYPISMREVPRKRHLGDDTFWTDTLAMNLRDTFDEAFLAAVRSHQGLPALPSPQINP